MDIIGPSDPVGDGFSFDVAIVGDVARAIIDFVLKSRVGACHVLCSSTILVATVTNELSKTLRVLSVTGDSSYQEQIRCAKNWLKGEHDVLVSTVVGLVGNENRFCKTIVVGGFLFNVSSLVQAIGRLRPIQRGAESKVQVFRFPFRSAVRLDASEKSKALFSEVCDAGCLNDINKDLFMKLYAPIGLQELLSLKQGCYLQVLSMFFGFARLRCGRCGLCSQVDIPDKSILSNDDRLPLVVGPPSQPNDNLKKQCALVNPYKKRATAYEMGNNDNKKARHIVTNTVVVNQHASVEHMKKS